MSEPVKTAERPDLPRVRARRGHISGAMKHYYDTYTKAHPGRDARFVRDSLRLPDQTNVTKRMAEGYEIVTWADLGGAFPGKSPTDPVRIGDVVLMSIEERLREEAFQAESDYAASELERVEKDYYDTQTEVEVVNPQTGQKHRAMPRGGVKIRQETIEVEREQPTSETREE